MPTDKPRVTITMSEEQFKRVEDYRYGNKMKNQTQAILSLIESGLSDLEEKTPDADNSESEGLFTQHEAERLLLALGLIKEGEQLSDDDLSFMAHVLGLMDAWFSGKRH